MKFDEVMKLLDAGYTKDEILAMKDESGDSKEDTKEDPKESETNDVTAITDALGEVKETFESFKKEMIAMNIMNSRIENPEQSADDIMGRIINPFENK